jgi:hypothetical protein
MMGGKPTQSKELGSSNLYSVLTILAALMLVPFGLAIEGPGVRLLDFVFFFGFVGVGGRIDRIVCLMLQYSRCRCRLGCVILPNLCVSYSLSPPRPSQQK